MSIDFEQGLKFVSDNMGAALGGQMSQLWLDTIDSQSESITNDIIAKVHSTDLPADKLRGIVSVIWHYGTFNAGSDVHSFFATAK